MRTLTFVRVGKTLLSEFFVLDLFRPGIFMIGFDLDQDGDILLAFQALGSAGGGKVGCADKVAFQYLIDALDCVAGDAGNFKCGASGNGQFRHSGVAQVHELQIGGGHLAAVF